jgi:hypothetical protein
MSAPGSPGLQDLDSPASASSGTLREVAAISAHEATRSYDCRTPGCRGETPAEGGLCRHCEQVQAERTGGADEPPVEVDDRPGSFEFKALALVQLGRELDAALGEYLPAEKRYKEAARRWQEAVESCVEAEALRKKLTSRKR